MKNILKVSAVIAKAREELKQLQQEDGVSFYTEAISKSIQLGSTTFMKTFDKANMKVEYRGSSDFPYEVSVNLEGIKIYSIMETKTHKRHFPELLTKEERRIVELEAEISSLKFEREQQLLEERGI